MAIPVHYQPFELRPGSNYQQWWVKGRHIRADILYRLTIGPEPQTPQEVAQNYALPVEVVQEAIEYAVQHEHLLDAERAREETRMQQLGLDKPPYVPADISTDA